MCPAMYLHLGFLGRSKSCSKCLYLLAQNILEGHPGYLVEHSPHARSGQDLERHRLRYRAAVKGLLRPQIANRHTKSLGPYSVDS